MGTRWLVNPLSNHIFVPFALILLALFAFAALALLMLQRLTLSDTGTAALQQPSQPGSIPWQVLWQRYRTWVLITLLFVGASFSGPLPIAVLCAFVTWQGGREYAALTDLCTWQTAILILSGWFTLLATLLFGSQALTFAPIMAFFTWSLLTLQPVERSNGRDANERVEMGRRFTTGHAGLWGYLYLGWLPAFLLVLSMRNISGLVMAAGVGVAMSDVGAFCAGKLLKGPRLAPRLSPSKTWSGVLGNILGASLALLLVSFALPRLFLWQYILFALAIGLCSVWGDLLESLLKRQGGVKDAGNLLPGFGGLLDRIDSLLLVAPVVYSLSLLFIR